MFTHSEVIVLMNRQTDRQMLIKISYALCYATTLGNHQSHKASLRQVSDKWTTITLSIRMKSHLQSLISTQRTLAVKDNNTKLCSNSSQQHVCRQWAESVSNTLEFTL